MYQFSIDKIFSDFISILMNTWYIDKIKKKHIIIMENKFVSFMKYRYTILETNDGIRVYHKT